MNSTTHPSLKTFTLDPADLNLFYINADAVFLVTLTGNQPKEFDGVSNTEYVSSYRNYAISYLGTFFVFSEIVLDFANGVDTEFQQYRSLANAGVTVTANSMFRQSLQPLPGQWLVQKARFRDIVLVVCACREWFKKGY